MKTLHASFFSVFFLVQCLTPNMDLCCEIQKLSNLSAGCEEGEACNDNPTILTLKEGFTNRDAAPQATEQEDEHDKRPFQEESKCCQTLLFLRMEQHFSVERLELNADNHEAFSIIDFCSHYPDSPFQPPQV